MSNIFPELKGLNPYSNGMYSMRLAQIPQRKSTTCLNPYSNGIYSMRLLSKNSISAGLAS